MIYDAHVHIFDMDSPRRETMLSDMKKAGVDGSAEDNMIEKIYNLNFKRFLGIK